MKHIILLCCITCTSIIRMNGQTGIPVPEMSQCDSLVKKFLADYDIPGATFAISKDGKMVYMRAFGFADTGKTTPTQPYNLFRIASLSKQVTSVAIMKLVENGQLDLSAKVFGPGGILQDHPVFSHTTIGDIRIYDITVQNLLEHSAGWDRDVDCNPDPTTPYPWFFGGCDPIVFPLHVTEQTKTTNPVTGAALIKFLLQKGLNFTPNTKYAYSNVGYLVLGEIIEQITGQRYVDYVKDTILAPLGIYDMHIANNLLSEKQEREVEYVGYGPGYETLSLYGDSSYVPYEYGGFNINAMDAHGGWIATARDLVRLLAAVDGFSTKPDILQPATITTMTTPSANNSYYAKGWGVYKVDGGYDWSHTGALPGTASILVRTAGGYSWVIILNKRNIINPNFFSDLNALPWNCIASTSSWPVFDLMESPTVNASKITFSNVTSNSITVNWINGNGDKRLLVVRPDSAINKYPLDGTDYAGNENLSLSTSLGTDNYIAYNGNGTSATIRGLAPGKTYYFRLIEYNRKTITGNNALYQLGNNAQSSTTTQAAPTVKINQAENQADPAGVAPIKFTAVFSVPVTGFTADDMVLSGAPSTTTIKVSELAPLDKTTYSIELKGLTCAPATITASIPRNAATDAVGTGNTASTSNDNIVIYKPQPPIISNVSVSPSTLPQNNHKMVTVKVNYTVTDNCSGTPPAPTLSVGSNEPVVGCGTGDKTPDWVVIDKNTVQLRAERCGNGRGRIYTIMITAKDAGNRVAARTISVTVPHSNSSSIVAGERVINESVAEVQRLQVNVRPNPTSNYFTLITRSDSQKKLNVIISDALGRVIESKTDVAANGSIELGHNYRSGLYIVQIIQGDRKVNVKLIKSN